MSKQLATTVHLTDDTGVVHTFLPGADVPKWAKKRITNPKAWAGGGEADQTEDESQDPAAGSGQQSSTEGQPPALSIPPKAGAGSGADKWRDYAAAAAEARGLSIEIAADASRSDIIEALESAQIPTE